MKTLSERMKRALLAIDARRNLGVGNHRLQHPDTYVPSNTFGALYDRGLVDAFWRGSGRHEHKMAFLTDEGKERVRLLKFNNLAANFGNANI
jgi:hypothetical protein